jgi:hypothetical protein
VSGFTDGQVIGADTIAVHLEDVFRPKTTPGLVHGNDVPFHIEKGHMGRERVQDGNLLIYRISPKFRDRRAGVIRIPRGIRLVRRKSFPDRKGGFPRQQVQSC